MGTKRLYYMTSLRVAQEHILPEQRMKLSTFDTLNDPHELLCALLVDKKERRVFGDLRSNWEKTLGIICTSEDWRSPLMWAHYADNHKGVCLGFDVNADLAMQMSYEPARLEGLLNGLDPSNVYDGAGEAMLRRVLTTKFEDWKYEREWRLMAHLTERDARTGHYYVDFGPDLMLREAIVGARCRIDVATLAKQIHAGPRDVQVFQVRAGFGKFEMVRQMRVPEVTVPAGRCGYGDKETKRNTHH